MTINLTELSDEALGKHPSQAAVCSGYFCVGCVVSQPVVAADDESSFTFDAHALGDESLDAPYKRPQLVCLNVLCGAGTSPWG